MSYELYINNIDLLISKNEIKNKSVDELWYIISELYNTNNELYKCIKKNENIDSSQFSKINIKENVNEKNNKNYILDNIQYNDILQYKYLQSSKL